MSVVVKPYFMYSRARLSPLSAWPQKIGASAARDPRHPSSGRHESMKPGQDSINRKVANALA